MGFWNALEISELLFGGEEEEVEKSNGAAGEACQSRWRVAENLGIDHILFKGT